MFVKQEIIPTDKKAVYTYGLELLISDIVGISCIILISFLYGQRVMWIPYLIGFVPLRVLGGGYHAKTHLSCILFFSSLFLLFIFLKDILQAVPYAQYNGRFIHEIEAFSFYEKCGVNRFQAFEKIRNGKVAIIGAGGVGSNVAVMLSAAGIGEIILIDEDWVEESNLVRQVFYEKSDCGKTKKVVALKRFLNKFSDYTKVSTVEHYIKSVSDAEKYLKDVDVVVQTADTPRGVINRIVNDYSTKSGCASIYCANGTIGPFYIPGRSCSFRDLEASLNRETGELYELFVEVKHKESSRAAPSEVGGPWLAAFYLYSEIVDFFVGIQNLKTENAIIRLGDGGFSVEFFPFKQIG